MEKVRELESEEAGGFPILTRHHTTNNEYKSQIRLKTLVRNAEREEKEAIKAREKTDHPNGFEATIEELEAQRDNVLGDDGEQERETKKLTKEIKKLEKELQSKRKKNGKLKEKQGRLQAKLEASQEMEDRLDSSIQDLASKYCVAVPSQQQGTQSQHDMMLKVANTFKQRLDTMLSSKDAQLQERTWCLCRSVNRRKSEIVRLILSTTFD